jgi:acyl-CoA reductase-like NAD-dependent aldehyde dehydrogenase
MKQTSTSHTEHTEPPFPLGNQYRLFIGGDWVESDEHSEIRFPYDRSILVGRVAWASRHNVDAALELAREGARTMATWPLHRRAALLHRIADLLAARTEHFASLIVYEVGKPI